MKKKSKLIAVTGGIGSGKSAVIKIVKDGGYKTFSCDEYTEKVYGEKKVLKKLAKSFPTAVDIKTGKVDKKELSKIVFSDEKKYAILSKTVTERIFKEIYRDAKKERDTVFIEVPLLFEYGYQDKFDTVIVVKRDMEKRIESVKLRSDLTEDEIKSRINKQVDGDIDYGKYTVIENNGDKESLKEKVLSIISIKK